MTQIAQYVRVSTAEQTPDRQLEETREWAVAEYDDPELEQYVDIISGTEEGDQYRELCADVGAGELDVVVVHEISRLSRLGAGEIQEFIQHCLEHDTAVKDLEVGLFLDVGEGEITRVAKEMIVNLMGDLARLEHKQLIRRINSGIRSAQEAGKWTGRPPVGFDVEDGYLRVDTEEFLRARHALEDILIRDKPVREAAREYGINEATLRDLRDDRLELYFSLTADDDRVAAALEDAELEATTPPIDGDEGVDEERIRLIVRDELERQDNI